MTINEVLATGREILALERRLSAFTPGDDRAQLGAEHTRLMRQQQDQILATARAGTAWDTIRFALTLHGQDADREPGSTDPTPAEQILALCREHGGVAVVEAIDAYLADVRAGRVPA